MSHRREYIEKRNSYNQYTEIKCLIDKYFEPVDDKKYEEFIRKLVMILKV